MWKFSDIPRWARGALKYSVKSVLISGWNVGGDLVLWHHPTRNRVGYFGAVRLHDGKSIYQREEQTLDKETYFHYSCV